MICRKKLSTIHLQRKLNNTKIVKSISIIYLDLCELMQLFIEGVNSFAKEDIIEDI